MIISTNIIEEAKPHTIQKFNLIEAYVDEWARKILGYSKSKGIVYIDCMCNCGIYRDESGKEIDGTAVKVIKKLNNIMDNSLYKGKRAVLYFNDYDGNKVKFLKKYVEENIKPQNIDIFYSSCDAHKFLQNLNIKKYEYYNTLLIYDPYQAMIDWDAINPFLNRWGEVIINHMVSDTVRGVGVVKSPEKIAKYQNTYCTDIDKLIEIGKDRSALNNIVLDIIKNQTKDSNRECFIASFPFCNRKNGYVYSLIHCCSNIEGLKLYKKIAWKTFGGKSSLQNTHGSENQMSLFLGTLEDEEFSSERATLYYDISDVVNYVVDVFANREMVALEEIYECLDYHPIFPSDGYKNEIKALLKSCHNVKCIRKNRKEHFTFGGIN